MRTELLAAAACGRCCAVGFCMRMQGQWQTLQLAWVPIRAPGSGRGNLPVTTGSEVGGMTENLQAAGTSTYAFRG
jgi:hypothetical protein